MQTSLSRKPAQCYIARRIDTGGWAMIGDYTQLSHRARAPLAAAILLAMSTLCNARSIHVATPQSWKPGDGTGVAALFHAMAGKPIKPKVAGATASLLAVTSCADDNGAGTLRSVISGANENDTVDLRGLSCSAITLTQGAIPVYLYSLTVLGRGVAQTIIDGNAADRVFAHYGYDTFALRDLTVRNGRNEVAGYHIAGGACILSNGYVVLDHAAVKDCASVGEGAYGGGILSRDVTMYTSTLSGNEAKGSLLATLTASYGGGAFAYRGTAALYDSTVADNRAIPDPRNAFGSYDTGAGLFVDNGGYATRSTISNNYTDGAGGGIATHNGFTISNSTISGNTASKKSGGGIFARAPAPLEIVSSTIADNTAARGGGIYILRAGANVDLQSSIVANNSTNDIAAQYAFAITGANNLIVAADRATVPSDTLHADPMLSPLASNGGPTRTQALGNASPAIDFGNNVFNLPTEQRGEGFPRVVGSAPDIGAYERSAAAPSLAQPVPAVSNHWLAALAAILALLGIRRRHLK